MRKDKRMNRGVRFERLQDRYESAEREIARLIEDRPAISVTPGVERHEGLFLEITNSGERGAFEAQIELLDGSHFIHGPRRPPLPRYTGYWQRSAGPVALLPQGHTDRLVLGRHELGPMGMMMAEFKMAFYDADNRHVGEYGTVSWGLNDNGGMPARFVLRVTISASPRLIDGPFVETYIVEGRRNDLLRVAKSSGSG